MSKRTCNGSLGKRGVYLNVRTGRPTKTKCLGCDVCAGATRQGSLLSVSKNPYERGADPLRRTSSWRDYERGVIKGDRLSRSPRRCERRYAPGLRRRHGQAVGVRYELALDRNDPTMSTWRVEAIDLDGDGECYLAVFSGPDSLDRASQYRDWMVAFDLVIERLENRRSAP